MRRRTRKWALVAQEAMRLASLGLKPKDIAARLDVDWSTVTRWRAAGKLQAPATGAPPPAQVEAVAVAGRKSPEEWAAAVRGAYALDATDEQLVTLAEAALRKAQDPLQTPQVQLSAITRFQAIVKQLALVARNEQEVPAPKPAEPEPRPSFARRVRTSDPRAQLMAVK